MQKNTERRKSTHPHRAWAIAAPLLLALLALSIVELAVAASHTKWGRDWKALHETWPLVNVPQLIARFNGSKSTVRAQAEYFIFDPVLGNRFRPNSLAYGLEPDENLQPRLAENLRLRIDARGFISHQSGSGAEMDQRVFPTNDQTLFIYVSGGSTAGGWGASDNEHTWPALLQKRLRKHLKTYPHATWSDVVVVNGGVFGYGVSQELRRYLDEISYFEPDMVVSFGGINERWGFNGFVVDYGLDGSQRQMMDRFNRGTLFTPPAILPYVRRAVYNIRNQAVPGTDEALYGFRASTATRASDSHLLTSKIEQFYALCRSQDIPFLYILQPAMGVGNKVLTAHEISLQGYLGGRYYPEPWDNYEKRIREFFAATQSALTENWHRDYTGIFDSIGDTVYFDPRHYNDRGNQIIADRVHHEIVQQLGL